MPAVDYIDVSVQIQAAGTTPSNLGRTLLLDHSGPAPGTAVATTIHRIAGHREYSTLRALETDISDTHIRAAASVYFQQDIYPKPLVVGYRQGAGHVHLMVGTAPIDVAAIELFGNDADLTINGTVLAGDGLDLDSATTYQTIAIGVAAGFNADGRYAGVTCTYDAVSGVFIIASSASFGSGASGPLADALGLSAATIYPAVEASETCNSALTRLANADADFGWVVPAAGITNGASASTDLVAMANWANSNDTMMIFDTFGNDVLSINEATTPAATISALRQNSVGAIYNGPSLQHAASAYTAIFSAINFDGSNTLRSGAHKVLQGVSPITLSDDERQELRRKRVNYYEKKGQLGFTREGWTFGTWIDVQYFGNWLQSESRRRIFDVFAAGEVNQIDDDDQLFRAISDVMEQGVVNGGIAPGTASARTIADIREATGNSDFSDFLPRGYYIWVPSFSEQSGSNRELRKGVPYKGWSLLRGFVNEAELSITLQP